MRGYLAHFTAILLATLLPAKAQDLAILTSFPERFSAEFVDLFADEFSGREAAGGRAGDESTAESGHDPGAGSGC